MPDQNITIRASEALVAAFRQKVWIEGQQRPSKALRAFMESVVGESEPKKGTTAEPEMKVPAEPSRKGRRPALVGTYVTTAEHEQIVEAAAPYGGIAAWLRGAIDSRLGKATELPARDEIKALYAATTELWNVGRNLNQIARHMNEAKRAGLPVATNELQPELVTKLAAAIDRLADNTDAVIAAAKRRGFGRG